MVGLIIIIYCLINVLVGFNKLITFKFNCCFCCVFGRVIYRPQGDWAVLTTWAIDCVSGSAIAQNETGMMATLAKHHGGQQDCRWQGDVGAVGLGT